MTTKLTDTDRLAEDELALVNDLAEAVGIDSLPRLVAEVREYRALLAGVPVDRAIVVDADDAGRVANLVRQLPDWTDLADRLRARLAERDARDGA